ncbi:MAG: DUF1236 domain-containing protein [Pseudorhodoplanes sp.]
MKRLFSLALASSAVIFATSGGAQAQSIGTATTSLNIRSGPGPDQPVIGQMRSRQRAAILGCVEGSLWCQVQFRGLQGWAYSRYMMLNAGGRQIVVTEPADMQGVPIMNYQAPAYASPGFATPRAAYRGAPRVVETMGAAPVMASDEALVAPSSNMVIGAPFAASPSPFVGTYVTTNPGESVWLQGDVVVGAGLPQSVTLNRVPDYRYQYVYVNETPVLVDPATRRIVYVFR